MTSSDFADKLERIQQKKIAQGQKDMSGYCFCGKLKQRHSNVEGMRCRKTKQTDTVGSIMSDKQINEAEFQKV